MKELVKVLKDEEILRLLSENPMLIKRPILISGKEILIGFKEQEWEVIGI